MALAVASTVYIDQQVLEVGGRLMRCIRVKRLLAICIIFIGGSTSLADKPAKPLAIDDVFNLRLAVDPQISPDRKRVLYVRQFNDIMTDQRHANLWIVNTDGTENRPLTTGNYNDSSPRWSPDG